jgi:hypothetical protein
MLARLRCDPALYFTISGDGSYVDKGANTAIGSYTVGSKIVGGGGMVSAHPFDVTFPIHTDIFKNVNVHFQTLNIGHAQIDSYMYKDIRDTGGGSRR